MATAVTHYTSYKARPFTREQRDKTTILFGGLTWKHERLVQGVFNNLNYNAKPLPNITRADLDAGKELIDVGACCPTIFTTGSLVNFLKTEVATNGKQKTLDDYVFLTAGACGQEDVVIQRLLLAVRGHFRFQKIDQAASREDRGAAGADVDQFFSGVEVRA